MRPLWIIPVSILALAGAIAIIASITPPSPAPTSPAGTDTALMESATPPRTSARDADRAGAIRQSDQPPVHETHITIVEPIDEAELYADEAVASSMTIPYDGPRRNDTSDVGDDDVDSAPASSSDGPVGMGGTIIHSAIGQDRGTSAPTRRTPRRDQQVAGEVFSDGGGAVPFRGALTQGSPAARQAAPAAPLWTGNERLQNGCICSEEPYPFQFRRQNAADDRETSRRLEDQIISSRGQQNVAVIVAYSERSEPLSRPFNDLRWEIFDENNPRSFASYWREVSGGAMWITGDIYGPYNVEGAQYSFDFVKGAVEAAERARDITWSTIDRLYVLVPPAKSRAADYRPMAAFGDSWDPAVELPDGRMITAAITIIDDQSMGVESPRNSGVFSGAGRHEFGHTLGWRHQGQLECGEASFTADDASDDARCEVGVGGIVIGGISMGNGRTPTARELEMVGWLPEDEVETITSNGSYEVTLQPLSAPGEGIRAIRVPSDPYGGNYMIELRRPVGMFEPDLWEHIWGVFRGPIVDMDGVFFSLEGEFVRGHGVLSSITLDMTPGLGPPRANAADRSPVPTESDPLDWMQSCLRVGETFVCPAFDTRFTLVELTEEHAVMRIEATGLPTVIDEEAIGTVSPFDVDGDGQITWGDYAELLADPSTPPAQLDELLQLLETAPDDGDEN